LGVGGSEMRGFFAALRMTNGRKYGSYFWDMTLAEVRHEIGISGYFDASAGDKFFLLKGSI
jgi:hypothetical protein